jgi:hypothetical protein
MRITTAPWMKTRRMLGGLALISACATFMLLGASLSAAQDTGTRSATSAAASESSSPGTPLAFDAFARAWYALTSYSATITVFEQKGALAKIRDDQTNDVILNFSFRKPSSVTVHVVSGPNTGGNLVGGNRMVVSRGSGFLAVFKKTVSLHDALVTTARGSSTDELSFGAIIAHLQNTPKRTRAQPPTSMFLTEPRFRFPYTACEPNLCLVVPKGFASGTTSSRDKLTGSGPTPPPPASEN